MTQDIPPKPQAREEKVSLWRYLRLFKRDILSAQPAKLYRAKMAEFKTPFFRSFLINQPAMINLVLKERPMDFPKSNRISEGLRPLLGNSVFLTNGETWLRQRRIIDPAFEGGRLRETFPAMVAAGQAAVERVTEGTLEVEEQTSHAAADVIFRTLFSIPIEHEIASSVFHAFRDYQRTQPILNAGAFFLLPRWMPRFHNRKTQRSARDIRRLITELTEARQKEIAEDAAPDDLATKIMTTCDPQTGSTFDKEEMVDQVAIFFLAGHETSASALAWALYLLARYPDAQTRVAAEAMDLGPEPEFADMRELRFTRDVFRETLRLYPPVPMMVRENLKPEAFRDRAVPCGSQIVLSPWHLHRHEGIWDRPDEFDPDRFGTEDGKACIRDAFIPFSAGPRVCTGAGFAMVEGPLLLAMLMRKWRVALPDEPAPEPVAHLTVRSRDGIRLVFSKR